MDTEKTQFRKRKANYPVKHKYRDEPLVNPQFEKIHSYSIHGNRMYQISNSEGVPMYSGPQIFEFGRRSKTKQGDIDNEE